MSIRAFNDEMKKGLKSPVYALISEDAFLLKEALTSIKQTVPEEGRSFLFHSIDFESPDKVPPIEHIVDLLNTVSLLGGRKVVVLEGCQKMSADASQVLTKYFTAPSPDSLLVVALAGTPKKAQKDMLAGVKTFLLEVREREMPEWVMHRAAQRGLKLTHKAVEYLIGTVGPEAGLLSAEVEKLSMMGKPNIDLEDLEALVKGQGDYDAFDLTRALGAGEARKVMEIYAVLARTQEPYNILGALNWHYGRAAGKKRKEIFSLLSEADFLVKSTGGAYPLEDLLVKLLRV